MTPWLVSVRKRRSSDPRVSSSEAAIRGALGPGSDRAIRAGERAVTLAPDVTAAHLGHGDILHRAGHPPDAERAYRRALARAEGRRGDAEALLTEALTVHPDHPCARINLATIAIRRQRVDEARRLLVSVQAQTGLPSGVRALASEALAAFDERERLRPSVDEALASNGPEPIELALRTLEPAGAVDGPLLAALSRVVERLARTPSIESRFTSLRAPSSAWPALEAHHGCRFDRDPRARERSLRLVAGTEPLRRSMTSTSSATRASPHRGAGCVRSRPMASRAKRCCAGRTRGSSAIATTIGRAC